MNNKLVKSILITAVPLAVTAAAGTVVTNLNLDYPKTLKLPPYYPPGWLFAVVWSIVYILIGVATVLALLKTKDAKEEEKILFPYSVQLILNFLWSAIFFAWRSPWLAFAEILLLAASIIWMIVVCKKQSGLSAWLLLPYILWVAFAAFALNLPIAVMN